MSSVKPIQKGGVKSKIICKYFIQGKCIKGENCPYLHSQIEKPKETEQVECPMYSIGFCKNGPVCHFLHIKKDKYVEEEIEEKNTNLTTPINEESNGSTKPLNNMNNNLSENNLKNIKEDKEKEKNEENLSFPELPIWYIEHYYEKPISMIYSELEQKNLPEIVELKKKYGFTNIEPNLPVLQHFNKKNKTNINLNTLNLNFNNFNMNLAFNNNRSDINSNNNNNIIKNSIQTNKDIKLDPYKLKKDSIEYLINKEDNIFYYLIRCKNYDEIKMSLDSNTISLPKELFNKYKDIDLKNKKLTIIIFVFDDEYENLHGFAQLKYPVTEQNFVKNENKIYNNNYKLEWLWRTKLNFSKISHLMNRADNDHFLNEGKNGCPIDKDLGNYCCRLMIKRLSKDEVKELIKEKEIFDNQQQNLGKEEYYSTHNNYKNQHNNHNHLNYYDYEKQDKYKANDCFDKKSNRYHEKSPHNNSNNKKYYNNTYSNRYNNYNKKEFKFTGNKKYRNNSKSRSHNRTDSEDYSGQKHNKKMKINDDYNKQYKYDYNRYKVRPKKDNKEFNDHHRYYNDDNKSTDFSSKKSFH